MSVPDCAEFIIGPAEGRTRWLHPGYWLRQRIPPSAYFIFVSSKRTLLSN
jgi:hypothetical protein